MDINIYVKSTIKAPRRGSGKAEYLIECPKKPDEIAKGFIELPDTTEDEIVLTILIKALNRFHKPCEMHIYTKSSGVFCAIDTGRIQKARDNGWKNAKGIPIKNAQLWDIFLELLDRHTWNVTQDDHSFMEIMRMDLKG